MSDDPHLLRPEVVPESVEPAPADDAVTESALTVAPPTPLATRLAPLPPLTPAAPPSPLSRGRALAATAVLHLQYRVAQLGLPGQIGALASVAAIVLGISLVLPGHRALSSLGAELGRLQTHPATGASGATTVFGFVQALPTRAEMPAVLGTFVEQARRANVQLDSGHYAFSPGHAGGIARYEVEFPIKGDYPNIRTFINSALVAVPAAGLDKLQVERRSIGDNSVSADVRFVVFVRSEP